MSCRSAVRHRIAVDGAHSVSFDPAHNLVRIHIHCRLAAGLNDNIMAMGRFSSSKAVFEVPVSFTAGICYGYVGNWLQSVGVIT